MCSIITKQSLNLAQSEAVNQIDNPLLILAGAGTGKTKTLTTRIAHIIESNVCNPYNVLAVTFTNKAAKEMRQRVSSMVGADDAKDIWLGTFHSICLRILRRFYEKIGYQQNFTILDKDDQLRLIKQLIRVKELDEKEYNPQHVLSIIQLWKDKAHLPEKLPQEEIEREPVISSLYTAYQRQLEGLNAFDFGDLLLKCLQLLLENEDILQKYQWQFKYILVDEYQDTNVAQYLWLRLLAQRWSNICCVGDDDQSIYGWRGAEIQNILNFTKDFPDAKIIKLEENYRSTPTILGIADKLISRNSLRHKKTLWTKRGDNGKFSIAQYYDGFEEALAVGKQIEQYCDNTANNQIKPLDIAILVRASYQTRLFEERLLTMRIPYRVIGSLKFYERQEIKDAVAYLRLTHSTADNLAFERVVNTPKRGIGQATVDKIRIIANAEDISLFTASYKYIAQTKGSSKAKQNLADFLEKIKQWQRHNATADDEQNLSTLLDLILKDSGYLEFWQQSQGVDAPARVENLKELSRALQAFTSLSAFLEHFALANEMSDANDEDSINIMTLHASKGLEFSVVFLPAWEDGSFPHQRVLGQLGDVGIEEERRLAYVGVTRAKKYLHISHCQHRMMYNNQWQTMKKSVFINDIEGNNKA
jgi:DNA helicase-2/ATP-dependent DNA helicase PcrA